MDMLESGVDLRFIQELIGYKNSKIKEIYTHVSQRDYIKFINPIDDIDPDDS